MNVVSIQPQTYILRIIFCKLKTFRMVAEHGDCPILAHKKVIMPIAKKIIKRIFCLNVYNVRVFF